MKIEVKWKALFVAGCFPKGCPLPTIHPSVLAEVYMQCFNRWAGWRRRLGCKTGTQNLYWVVLNWVLVKFTDIYWPRQTRLDSDMLTHTGLYTLELKGFISTIQRKFKAELILYIFLPHAPISSTQTHTLRYMHVYIRSYYIKINVLYILKDRTIPNTRANSP